MPKTAQKYELSFFRACRKVHISWDGLQFLCISLCRSLLKSMIYLFLRACRKGDIRQDSLRFLCISLCRRLLKSHLRPCSKLGISWDGLQFYALACAGAYSKVWVILSQSMQKTYISSDSLQFLCISLCQSVRKNMSYPISYHADELILDEKVFHFYALACAGAYYKVWVIPSQFIQKKTKWLRRSSISVHERVPEPILAEMVFTCLYISLCWSLLERMSYPILDHAEKCIFAQTVSDFYALACARAYSKYDYPISDHAEKLILAETVFNFYAIACAGDYSKA